MASGTSALLLGLACSTPPPASAVTQKDEAARLAEEAEQRDALRRRLNQEAQDAKNAKNAKAEATREAEERRSACKAELIKLHERRRVEAAAAKEQQAVATCPDSGIPPGIYKTRSGMPDAELQVTEAGCAAYRAYTYNDGEHSRAYETSEGTPSVTYQRRYECTVGGILDAQRRPTHGSWDGTGCLRQIADVLAEGTPWTVTGTTVSAMANDSRGKRRISLTRVSADVSAWSGVSPLWQKQRRESDSRARVSVAFAQPEPWQEPDAGQDWCAELQVQQAAGSSLPPSGTQ
jgi:hypothetical protein